MSLPVCLFVSPHLDDAALSCGGLIRRLTRRGARVTVATLVTADLPAGHPESRLALRCQRQWDLWQAPFAARRAEDQRALQTLQATPVHLGLLDAIHRTSADGQPYYPRTILDQPVPDQDWAGFGAQVRDLLTAQIAAPGAGWTHVFLPLGIAGHVDHHIVRRAADQVRTDAVRIYYEEYPYAGMRGAPRPGADWRPVTVALDANEIEARQAAIACYASAIAFLFPSRLQTLLEIAHARLPFLERVPAWRPSPRASLRRMDRSLRAYVARVGGERYWVPAGQPASLPV